MLNTAIEEAARRSVLCWLATVDQSGHPHVSPKEVFAIFDAQHVVVANIASRGSARNLSTNPKVCLSFVDVFIQKGFKLLGTARSVEPHQSEFAAWAKPLVHMAGPRFALQSVFVVQVTATEPILAPSYLFYPDEVSEASQITAAHRRYGVMPVAPKLDSEFARTPRS